MLDQLRTYTSYTFTHAPALKLECWHKCMHASVCAYSTCTRHTCTSVHALTQTHTHRHIGTCGSRTRVCTYMRTHANTRTHILARAHTHPHAGSWQPRTYSRTCTTLRSQRTCSTSSPSAKRASTTTLRCATSVQGMAMWVAVRVYRYACRLAYMQMMHTSIRTWRT